MPCSACAKNKTIVANQKTAQSPNAPKPSPVVTNPPPSPNKKFPPKVLSELPPIR